MKKIATAITTTALVFAFTVTGTTTAQALPVLLYTELHQNDPTLSDADAAQIKTFFNDRCKAITFGRLSVGRVNEKTVTTSLREWYDITTTKKNIWLVTSTLRQCA